MVSCISWPCSQGRSERGKGATGIATFVQLARAGTWWPRSFHKNRMGYLPWLISSHQSVFMNGCLIISHTCLPCLPSGRTLLFWGGLFVIEREVSWETWESCELRRWERFMSGVRWQGGKAARIVRWHSRRDGKVVRWLFGKDGRVVRWQGGRFPVLFKVRDCRARPRFHLFVCDANHQNEETWCVQDIFGWLQR